MAKVTIRNTDKTLIVSHGTNILQALLDHGYPIATSCGGRAVCSMCRITIVSGKEYLNSINEREIYHIGNVANVIGKRLACQTVVEREGDIVIDVPAVEDIVAKKQDKFTRLQLRRLDKE